jgi:hypothetical protein
VPEGDETPHEKLGEVREVASARSDATPAGFDANAQCLDAVFEALVADVHQSFGAGESRIE